MGTEPTPKSSWALAMSSHRLFVSVRRLVSSRPQDSSSLEFPWGLQMSWRSGSQQGGSHTAGEGRRRGKKRQWKLILIRKLQMSNYFNFLKLLWPFTDTLCNAKVLCLGAELKKEEGDCYYKLNALEVTVISLAFSKRTGLINFLLIYAKVKLESTSKAL